MKQAGQIEAALAAPLAGVSQAGAHFGQAQTARATLVDRLVGASAEPALLSAWRQIESLRGRLAALPAPAPATRLRSLVLQMVDLEARTTREVAMLVAFLPRFAAALRPLGPATQRLELVLSQRSAYGAAAVAAAYAGKAAALRHFQSSADAILGRLRRLRPPAVSRPGYRAQLVALEGMSTDAGLLARSLENGAQGDVGQLLTDFDRAALSTQSAAAQNAQIASIRVYDSQPDKLATLSVEIDRERARLADTLR
jgi:hypothetical protein